MTTPHHDVAIIGGGPAGTTVASLLKKYAPELSVAIFERERFPREHVGESQLPPIGAVLDEMGCWDKVEAANFPIKIGATYRWGSTDELWDFDFLPDVEFADEARPARFEGQRVQTAFQVERAIYDDILLRHAESLGCDVHEEAGVACVQVDGDRITGLELQDGSVVTATHYVDASGHLGILRRAVGVEVTVPTRLKNIAVYDYWENAEWATEIGNGGTRVQVMSQDSGWLWFIPLGPTRTSIGFVCPADYYKSLDESPEAMYHRIVAADPRIAPLVANATCRGEIETVKDWSFLAERNAGDNWFLVGEAGGFADPVLAAGLTLTHTGARDLAYVLLALARGEHDPDWLKTHYDTTQRQRLHQHIRFADFWYASNGQFTDLQDHCAEIAREAGLRLTPQAAWQWLAQGGFTHDAIGQPGIGSLDLVALKQITQRFGGKQATWLLNRYNAFKLNLVGAKEEWVPSMADGRIDKVRCYTKGAKRLPLTGIYAIVVEQLEHSSSVVDLYNTLGQHFSESMTAAHAHVALQKVVQALEVMVSEGWVTAKLNKKKPKLTLDTPDDGGVIHRNRDEPVGPRSH